MKILRVCLVLACYKILVKLLTEFCSMICLIEKMQEFEFRIHSMIYGVLTFWPGDQKKVLAAYLNGGFGVARGYSG